MNAIRELAKRTYFLAQSLLLRERRLLRTIRVHGHVVVLSLHQVSPRANAFWPAMHPSLFEDLLVFLSRKFVLTTFRDLHEIPPDRRAAVLSFDDGYFNFVEYALPLLQKHNVPSNLNVIGECVESGQPIWNVRLYDLLAFAPQVLLADLRVSGFDRKLSGGASSKLAFGLALSRHLKNRPRKEREELLDSIAPLLAETPHDRRTRMMSIEDVRALCGEVEVGCHSYGHDSMAYETTDFFHADLAKCSRLFREHLGLPIEIYAFPNGSYTVEHVGILRQQGIRHILLVGEDYATRAGPTYCRFTISGTSARQIQFQTLGYKRGVAR